MTRSLTTRAPCTLWQLQRARSSRLRLQQMQADLSEVSIGKLHGVSQVIGKRSISPVNFVESCCQRLRLGSHDGLHCGEIRGFGKSKSELQIGRRAIDGLRGKQKLVGEHVILNHRVARNSESGEENGAEHASAVLAGGAVFYDRQVARSDALKNLAILPRVLDGVIVRARS